MPRRNHTPTQKVTGPPARAAGFETVSKPLLRPAVWHYLVLGLVLLLAGFFRFHQLTTVPPGLSPDEAMEGSNALEALETHHFQVFYPENNGREGLYANAVAASVAVFGNTKLAVRLPAAVCGTLTVWGLYCLAAELFPIPVALLASFLLAASFWHIVASRLAGHAIMAPLFLVWALFFLVHAVQRLGQARFPLAAVICGGLSFGLGFHSYAAYRIAPLLIGLVFVVGFLQAQSTGRLRPFGLLLAGYSVSAALACLPLALYFAGHPEMLWHRASQISVFNAADPVSRIAANVWKTALMFFLQGDRNWRHNFSGSPELFWPVALCFLAGGVFAVRELLAGLRDARQQPVDTRIWLRGIAGLGWLLIGAIPAVVSGEGIPHALRSVVFAPAVFLLAAAGAWRAYSWAKMKMRMPGHLAQIGVCAILLGLCVQSYSMYFEAWAKRPEVAAAHLDFAEDIAGAIGRLPNQTPKYVVLGTQFLPVRGIPLIAQPIMYLTGSFTVRGQSERHIYYVTNENAASLGIAADPAQSLCGRVRTAHPYAEAFCIR
jgi:4-amino-4-deoxy-L-arabinose transferase-like glycosyltransferase